MKHNSIFWQIRCFLHNLVSKNPEGNQTNFLTILYEGFWLDFIEDSQTLKWNQNLVKNLFENFFYKKIVMTYNKNSNFWTLFYFSSIFYTLCIICSTHILLIYVYIFGYNLIFLHIKIYKLKIENNYLKKNENRNRLV